MSTPLENAIQLFGCFELSDEIVTDLLDHLKPGYVTEEVKEFIEELQRVDHKFDEIASELQFDENNSVSMEQAKQLGLQIYPIVPEKTLTPMLNRLDKDDNDKIDRMELKGFIFNLASKVNRCKRAFKSLDKDNSGTLTFDEAEEYFKKDLEVDHFFVGGVFHDASTDGNDTLDINEFTKFYITYTGTM